MSKKNPQNPLIINKKEFYCENCNYLTSNKKDFLKHENTSKHKRNVTVDVTTAIQPSSIDVKTNKCKLCNEAFSNRMALCRHKKNCEKTFENNDENTIKPLVSNKISSECLLMELINQNKEFKDMLMDQQKEINNAMLSQQKAIIETNNKLVEISSKPTTLIQNNTMNNTTTNNFNLNVFLNEQCKDAISITDFVNSLNLNVSDLEETGKLGYVLGISRIFINKLKELDVYERPLHCTDLKRETVYIKNQNSWEKDQEKTKLKNIVNKIAHKNLQQLPAWQAENPDFKTLNTPENNQFMKISLNSLGGYNQEEENKQFDKIMRNVLKEVIIDKNTITE
jgi:hypothetical protein